MTDLETLMLMLNRARINFSVEENCWLDIHTDDNGIVSFEFNADDSLYAVYQDNHENS